MSCRIQGIHVIVLIVEDNALLAFMMEDALSGSGHVVLGPANRADAALRLAEEARPDLALVDIDLDGERSGIALARELRDRWGVPTLFATGQAGEARENDDAALGVLTKPFSPTTIVGAVDVIAKVLQGHRASSIPPELELFHGG
jgi:DNA-binding response OmpR family regulator